MKNTSYKEMLRNRISNIRSIDLALKWCKAKERWIDHAYDSFINIYVEKTDRYEATRILLGISNKSRKFNFHSTIDWDNLDNYERAYWESIESWVNWFNENLESVQQDIQSGVDITKEYKTISAAFAKYLLNNI